jgi:energy-coupling factor transporter ATP-binding protein EcfA2
VTDTAQDSRLLHAVQSLRGAVEAARLPLDVPGATDARRSQSSLLRQLDDYVIPRLAALDAPLLAVVGGSTGAGKSTLVNSIVGHVVSRSGVLRPTTRASVLVHHPEDERWFTGTRVLPGLGRLTGAEGPDDDPSSVRLVASDALPPGLALLDAPDIDSVVEANRDLARQLLSAADLWLFVTTAARYADAVPWDLLREASDRGTSVAIVLDRVPPEAMEEVRGHLASMLAEQGLGTAPVFTVVETALVNGLLPETEIGRLRSWLQSLAQDAKARATVIKRTLTGALDSLGDRAGLLAAATAQQENAIEGLRASAATAYADALAGVSEGMSDGSLLRGEVLARWQEFVGTGEFLRQIEAGVSKLRDRVTAFFRGRQVPSEDLGEALQTGAAALLVSHSQGAASAAARRWRSLPGGPALLERHPELAKTTPGSDAAVERLVRDWQGGVLELERSEAGGRRNTARVLAFGVNGIAVMLMLLTFSATAGLSGAEIGIAGGSAVLAQRLLEAVFGDQAVRELAAKARRDLLARTEALYAQERSRFDAALDEVRVDPEAAARLSSAARAVETAR